MTGKYIAFADGDDWYSHDMLEKYMQLAESSDADFVISNYKTFDETTKKENFPDDNRLWTELIKFISTSDFESIRKKILKLIPVPWRKFYRHEFIKRHNSKFPEGNFFYEDNPFHWFCTVSATKITTLDEVTSYHRINRPGQTMQSSGKELLAFYEHYNTIVKWLTINNKLHDFESEPITWLTSQIDWTSRKISQTYWPALYREIVKIFSSYPDDTIFKVFENYSPGDRVWVLIVSAICNDYFEFMSILRFGVCRFIDNTDSIRKKISTLVDGHVSNLDTHITKLELLMKSNLILLEDLKGSFKNK